MSREQASRPTRSDNQAVFDEAGEGAGVSLKPLVGSVCAQSQTRSDGEAPTR